MIKTLSDKQIEIKIIFDKPELISMNSQSELDQIMVKISKSLELHDKTGNSLVLDEFISRQGHLELSVPV